MWNTWQWANSLLLTSGKFQVLFSNWSLTIFWFISESFCWIFVFRHFTLLSFTAVHFLKVTKMFSSKTFSSFMISSLFSNYNSLSFFLSFSPVVIFWKSSISLKLALPLTSKHYKLLTELFSYDFVLFVIQYFYQEDLLTS